jgi:hypothetical protein
LKPLKKALEFFPAFFLLNFQVFGRFCVSISLKKMAQFSSMRAPNMASDSGFLPEKKLEKGEPHSE